MVLIRPAGRRRLQSPRGVCDDGRMMTPPDPTTGEPVRAADVLVAAITRYRIPPARNAGKVGFVFREKAFDVQPLKGRLIST